MMIMQPDVVTPEVFADALEKAAKKKSPQTIGRLRLERFRRRTVGSDDAFGPYAAEGLAIAQLHSFIAEAGCERAGKHHEIYLSDPRRVGPEKMRTILRQPVAPAGSV